MEELSLENNFEFLNGRFGKMPRLGVFEKPLNRGLDRDEPLFRRLGKKAGASSRRTSSWALPRTGCSTSAGLVSKLAFKID